MILWRISNYPTLDGGGGVEAPGRWHSAGRPIVYCSPNPATAVLEVLVHTRIDLEDMPAHFQYLEVETPEVISSETVDVKALGRNWQRSHETTRAAGNDWLAQQRTALLHVPSVIVPATWNVLINPLHADSAAIRVVRVHKQPIDPRLGR